MIIQMLWTCIYIRCSVLWSGWWDDDIILFPHSLDTGHTVLVFTGEAYVSGSWHRVPGSQSVLSCISINNTDCCSSSQHCPPSDRVQQSKVQLLIISSMLSEVSTVSHVRNMNLILVCVWVKFLTITMRKQWGLSVTNQCSTLYLSCPCYISMFCCI